MPWKKRSMPPRPHCWCFWIRLPFYQVIKRMAPNTSKVCGARIPSGNSAGCSARSPRPKPRWKLVFGHHPIYSASPYHGDTLELQSRLLPILQAHHVQAYICGHEHDLQHLAADGVDYFVSGAGAECRESGWSSASRYSVSELGFGVVSLTADRLRVEFYDANGKLIYEVGKHLSPLTDNCTLSL